MKSSLIGTIFLSEKRKDVLLFIKDEAKTIEEIKTSLDVTSSAIMPQIKILISQGLVVCDNRKYKLSPMGKIIVKKMEPLLETLDVFEVNKDYWKSHNISVIPPDLQDRIGELGKSVLIKPDMNHMYEMSSELSKNLKESEHIVKVSTYFGPGCPKFYVWLAEKGKDVTIIATKNMFKRFMSDYREDILKFLKLEGKLYICCEDIINVASCVVSDKVFSMTLFYKDGICYNHNMLFFEPSALEWGKDLAKYYMQSSKQVHRLPHLEEVTYEDWENSISQKA